LLAALGVLMVETPELDKRINVVITKSFDLGFIAVTENNDEVQLRAPEMKEDLLKPCRDGKESECFGKELWVYPFKEFPQRVSQFSQLELEVKKKQDAPIVNAWAKVLTDRTKNK
jgi:hypothetical protein